MAVVPQLAHFSARAHRSLHVVPAGANATLLAGFKAAMVANCADLRPDHRGTEAVHNHGIDYALDLSYALRVFPDLVDATTQAVWRQAALQTWQDWLGGVVYREGRGHALMENSEDYNGISLTRPAQPFACS